MPVGTASVPQPSSIMTEAMKRPMSVLGVISPKPTVVMVVMAQYTAVGMDSNPLLGPSTTYIRVPITSTIMSTAVRNTVILRRLARSACPRLLYSVMYAVSLKMRNTRSRRSTRTSMRACSSGKNSAR